MSLEALSSFKQIKGKPNMSLETLRLVSSIPIWPLLVLIPALTLFLRLIRKPKEDFNKPPSPPRLPIIGNLYQLDALLHRSLAKHAEKYGPVMLLHFGRKPYIILSSAAAAKDALKVHDADFCDRPSMFCPAKLSYNYKDVAFTPYREYWRQMAGKDRVSEQDLESLEYLKMVLKETLRLHPPAPLLLPKQTTANTEVLGYHIKAETRVYINAWAIGRDPKTWEKPDKFSPERFEDSPIDYKGQNFELIPFGGGRRMCPGINMGMSTVQLSLANMLHSFDWKLPEGMTREDISMEEGAGLTSYKKIPLKLVPVRFQTSVS